MKKIAMFVFNGDPMCFIHVLLNALDMAEKDDDVKIVMEGSAVKLVADLADQQHPLHKLWEKSRAAGLVDGVCKACSGKMGVLDAARSQNLTLLDDMSGHPSMAGYMSKGFTIITF